MLHSLQMICSWENREQLFEELRVTVRKQVGMRCGAMHALLTCVVLQLAMGQMPSVQPHHALVYPLDSDTILSISKARALVFGYANALLIAAQAYAAQVMRNAQCFSVPPHAYPTTLSPAGRLRIGCVKLLALSWCNEQDC